MIGVIDELFDRAVFPSFTNIGYMLRRPFWRRADLEVDLAGRVAIVTGASSGLGKATASELAARGAEVWLLVRDLTRGNKVLEELSKKTGNEKLRVEEVDLSSQQSIRAFVRRFRRKSKRLDLLVNNASVLLDKRQESVDGIELTFATNTLGYFLLTQLLIPVLEQSAPSRVINVSSGGMYAVRLHPEDLEYKKRPYDGVRAYAETKRAEVVLTDCWSKEYEGRGIFFASMHPGWVDTPGLARSLPRFYKLMRPFLRTPRQGADTILWLAVCPTISQADSGLFWFDRRSRPKHILSSTYNTDAEISQFLRECVNLTSR
ncbi:MAG: SDR family NAD(P)-dependent oxidoreductase [Acidobacteriota bacterium]|nr:SDR family NAD(P)-dependent oxidoreductase [Blastocatellia bacterium]MDW8413369.1 SDR family NAD(P)-dependent oxidoreductase [Acidobacteriota bacterium]